MPGGARFAPLAREEPFDPKAHLWRPQVTKGAPGRRDAGDTSSEKAELAPKEGASRARRGPRVPTLLVRRREPLEAEDSDSDDEGPPLAGRFVGGVVCFGLLLLIAVGVAVWGRRARHARAHRLLAAAALAARAAATATVAGAAARHLRGGGGGGRGGGLRGAGHL